MAISHIGQHAAQGDFVGMASEVHVPLKSLSNSTFSKTNAAKGPGLANHLTAEAKLKGVTEEDPGLQDRAV